MSTVADDLLNDFGSSGDEAEDEVEDRGLEQNGQNDTNGDRDSMDVDGGGDVDGDGDNNMNGDKADDLGDEEETRLKMEKIEKMQLGGVKDVRSVASLMQTLQPILEVSSCPPSPHPPPLCRHRFDASCGLSRLHLLLLHPR